MTARVQELALDPENPRLPEELQGAPQAQIWEYLYDEAVLSELEESMLENGFFQHEPLIVLPPGDGGQRIVVEGNRRLAALMHLHGLPVAQGRPLAFEPTDDQLARLAEVPCFEVADRQEVSKFLGFRHIGGMKPWEPEAKARYLSKAVDEAHAAGEQHPFREVGRQVGSNAQGVRNSYVALATLRYARDEGGVDIGPVMRERFTVWLRCMNSAAIKAYIGLGPTSTYEQVHSALVGLDLNKTAEVIGDLTPPAGGGKAVVADSRDVTQYGMVLSEPRAREILRQYDDFELARSVILHQSLAKRVDDITRRVQAVKEEVERAELSAEDDLVAAVDTLQKTARLLKASVEVLKEG